MRHRKSFRSIVLAGAVAVLASGSGYAATYTIVAHVPANPPALNGIDAVLAVDPQGRLFGTQSGTSGGQVFVLTPTGTQGLRFKYHTAFSFAPYASKGPANPTGGVAIAQGGLVGPFTIGGPGCGGIFRLDTPDSPLLSVLHYFAGVHVSPPDGSCPESGLTAGLGNYLYGTTIATSYENATVFAISGSAKAPAYQIIHRFGVDASPSPGNLAVDGQGRLFGALETASDTETTGGVYVMQFTKGKWQEELLYAFSPATSQYNLGTPRANIVLDSQGNIYGCAHYGFLWPGRHLPRCAAGGAWQ